MVIAAAPATPSLPTRVEQATTARIADGEHPATVVAIVDGERSHVYGFGKLDNGKASDAGTVFQIGSITQIFTAALPADTIERGEVELDTPVGALFPGVSIASRDNKQITPGELAMQDSGLPRLPDNLRPADMRDPYAGYDAARRKAFLADCKLPRDPGARYEHSNLGVGLLGYAFAQRAGTSYAALVTKRILGPLGMSSTTATFELPLGPDWAQGHNVEGKPAQPCISACWPVRAPSTAPARTCCVTSRSILATDRRGWLWRCGLHTSHGAASARASASASPG